MTTRVTSEYLTQ